MRRPTLSKRPSPAAILALIALFVSLGGGAYALSKNSVGSKQLKKNAVKSKHIKKNQVKGSDVKESTLKKVPSAAAADSATTANSASTANTATSADTAASAADADALAGVEGFRVASFTLGNNQSRTILTRGPFELTARCTINAAGTDTAEVEITTSAANSTLDGDDTEADFDPADNPKEFAETSTATGTAQIDQETDGFAADTDGTEILGQEFYVGVNVLNRPGQCSFGGLLFLSG